ncbi:MAG TPA: hypothetical protein VEL73_04735, partial [Mycobacteriales bacterium]|nr:hypothetical protein [Mycobacteriales bacterium]
AWERSAYTRAGARPARRMIGSRWREVEIHRIDLDDGYGPGDWPAAFVAPLLPSLLDPDRLGPRLPAGMTLDVTDTDSGRRRSVVGSAVGADGAPGGAAGTDAAGAGAADATGGAPRSGRRVAVTGPSWALVCWLVGRPAAVRRELGDPPPLTPWS